MRTLTHNMNGTAEFSSCSRFRYSLTREWDATRPWCCFIGLNPSTADANTDDPTIRRCVGFAKSWGYGNLLMLNLFAYRTPSPKEMFNAWKRGTDIIGGAENYFTSLQRKMNKAAVTVAAWGAHGGGRGLDALLHLRGLHYLALNSDGSPKHPLYLRGDLLPISYTLQSRSTARERDLLPELERLEAGTCSAQSERADSLDTNRSLQCGHGGRDEP